MEGNGNLSSYEQWKIAHVSSKRPSGVGIAGLVLGTVGTVAAVGGALWAGSRAKAAQDISKARYDGLRDLVYTNASTIASERQERIAGDINLTNTVNDSVSGSQQGTLTAQQMAELSAAQSVQQVQSNLFNQAVLGNLSENPQKVYLMSAPQPCSCPNSCGCGR